MGLDGFSLGNLGLATDLTSAQMSNQAEHLARKGSEFIIKDVSKAVESTEVKIKDEEETPQEGFKQKDRKKKDNQDKGLGLSIEDFESQNPKEFSVRINSETEMVELYSNKNNRIIETMSADDLMELLAKLNGASGILVNRKI